MANVLSKEKQATVIAGLAEGNSIRSMERMTGIHRDTIMRLGVRVGETCAQLMHDNMRGLTSSRIEVDELWGFIGKKRRHVLPTDPPEVGDVWTFVAIDPETKVVPCFCVGKRDAKTADAFIGDLAGRLKNRIQLSADNLNAYVLAVQETFGVNGVDFGQIVKTYTPPERATAASIRYSPGDIVTVSKNRVFGNPDRDKICTSYIERVNLTTRMHVRRLARLTNAFSKKLENFKAAIGLHFAYYNFVKKHGTIGTTPAVAAGVTLGPWTVADLVEAAA